DRVLARAHRAHRLLLVAGLPPLGELHAEPHPGMVEGVGLEVALARVLAEDDAVDALQIRVALDARAGLARRLGGDGSGNPPPPVPGVGMSGKPRRDASLALDGAHALQRSEHL